MEAGWFPTDPYLLTGDVAAASLRPVNQGDIFGYDRLPMGFEPAKREDQPPKVNFTKATAFMVTSHPCTSRSKGRLNDLVTVSPISSLSSLNPAWGPPWAEGNYKLFPLPGFVGEDRAVNLGLSAVYKTSRLEQRLGILSKDGFVALQRRLCEVATRVAPSIAEIAPRADAYWTEFDLWERWARLQGSEDGFETWYSAPSTLRPDWVRREAWEMLTQAGLEQEMDEHFSAG